MEEEVFGKAKDFGKLEVRTTACSVAIHESITNVHLYMQSNKIHTVFK